MIDIHDLFVTLNVNTTATAIVGGFLLGLFVVVETVETVLERMLKNGHLEGILHLIPLLLLVVGLPIQATFWISAVLTDVFTGSENVMLRAVGRGFSDTIFLVSCAIGTSAALRRRDRRHPH